MNVISSIQLLLIFSCASAHLTVPQVCLKDDIPANCECRAAVKTGSFKMPAHTSYVHHTFASQFSKLEAEIDILADPMAGAQSGANQQGLYVAPYNGKIDDTSFYMGLQTNLADNDRQRKMGKGFIFSRWDTQDANSLKIAPGGFSEVGDHEGNFIGVRLPFGWKVGRYKIILTRGAPQGSSDWFELSVEHQGKITEAGALLFPRRNPSISASIQPTGVTFTEVYAGPGAYREVPQWVFTLSVFGDGAIANALRSEYPSFPYALFRITDVFWSTRQKALLFAFGGDTQQCHAAGVLRNVSK